MAATAPNVMPNRCWIHGSTRARIVFRLQATTSHSSVAGRAAPLSTATRNSQSMAVAAPNIAPTDITVSTNRTARRITPTWQASNTSTRAGASARADSPGRSWNADNICESFIKKRCLRPDYW